MLQKKREGIELEQMRVDLHNHTTLCNHLLILTRRATTTAELDKITYSADCLPLDLAENMKKILVAAGITE